MRRRELVYGVVRVEVVVERTRMEVERGVYVLKRETVLAWWVREVVALPS